MQEQADLIGQRGSATGAIRRQLGLVQLDQVFALSPGTIEAFIQPFRRADIQAGDDKADIQAEPCGLDTGDDAALSFPGSRLVNGLGKTAQGVLVSIGIEVWL